MDDNRIKKLPAPSIEFAQELEKIGASYNYCEKLTTELDTLSGGETPVSREDVFRIVLWKLNRYPVVSGALMQDLEDFRQNPSHESGKAILLRLLDKNECGGFDLPMASTVLRFLAPHHFAVIDQRVYRLIMPDKNRLSLASKSGEAKAALYESYLVRLREVAAAHSIPFHLADRILYQYDKEVNKDNPIH